MTNKKGKQILSKDKAINRKTLRYYPDVRIIGQGF